MLLRLVKRAWYKFRTLGLLVLVEAREVHPLQSLRYQSTAAEANEVRPRHLVNRLVSVVRFYRGFKGERHGPAHLRRDRLHGAFDGIDALDELLHLLLLERVAVLLELLLPPLVHLLLPERAVLLLELLPGLFTMSRMPPGSDSQVWASRADSSVAFCINAIVGSVFWRKDMMTFFAFAGTRLLELSSSAEV